MGECVGSVKVFGGSGSGVWSTRWASVWGVCVGSVKVFGGVGVECRGLGGACGECEGVWGSGSVV